MKRLLICAFLTITYFHLQAQIKNTKEQFSLAWYTGKILFHTGDSIRCALRYNQGIAEGVLQVMEGQDIITLSAQDVRSFCFYDSSKQRTRFFSSCSLATDKDYERAFFLERIYNDKQFSILNHRTRGLQYDFMNYTRFISKPVRVSRKYILNQNTGELLPLSRENALKLLDRRKSEISAYIQSNRLKFKKTADYIHLFQYHSSL